MEKLPYTVIGSGPMGLMVAMDLLAAGHDVNLVADPFSCTDFVESMPIIYFFGSHCHQAITNFTDDIQARKF